ncbi:MAG TPA: hypothetical protein VES73_17995 [Lamprocystis sp. (in: g-proteobacteria)]|nr:hypothetical protein [Lamprocystis sp. (in: g-proteobacteria)]
MTTAMIHPIRTGIDRLRAAFCLLPIWSVLMLLSGAGQAAIMVVAGVTFDTANAISTAIIVSGGYDSPRGNALHSGTSPSWDVPDALGTRFLVPTFQSSAGTSPTYTGLPGSAVTLGHDANFPQTSNNPRDMIQVGWGATRGLANLSGADLAIFEAATSEAYGVRLYADNTAAWTNWRYTPYQSAYDAANDATPTLIDFSDFGVGTSAVVTALEITNLLISDRVDTPITGTLGKGTVRFDGVGNYQPGRYSTSQGQWVEFESTKFDPDIQYVAGLHDLTMGSFGAIPAASFVLPLSPNFAPATPSDAPAPPTLALLAPLLFWPLIQPAFRPLRLGHEKGPCSINAAKGCEKRARKASPGRPTTQTPDHNERQLPLRKNINVVGPGGTGVSRGTVSVKCPIPGTVYLFPGSVN